MRPTSTRSVFATLFAVILSSSVHGAVETSPLRVRLGTEGDILAWLVAGPYPNEGALQRRGTGFRTDYLKPESTANPREGEQSGAFAWQLFTGSRRDGLDLNAAIGNKQPAIGYCFVRLVSPRATDARLLFGSDDGARVWLNGEVLYEKQVVRGVRRDEESLSIRLRQGENRLLFKVEQGDGGWGLMARVVGANGRPIPGVVAELDVQKRGKSAAPYRGFAGKAGALDLESAVAFDAIARTAERWVERFRSDAEDPDRLKKTILDARKATARASEPDAFSLAAAEGLKKVEDDYRRARRRFLRWAQKPGPLFATTVSKEDFIGVMKGGRIFVHSNGQPFVPVGYNHNPDWAELVEEDRLSDQSKPGSADRWFKNLAEHGVDVIRLMVETPPSGNLEESPGVFRPEHVRWLDAVFGAARKYGVRLWVTPYDTFWMNLRADASPYWTFNGGPVHPDRKSEFLTDPKIREIQKGRMRWLIDRYGNSDTVFAWEIMNEIDLWWGASSEQIRAWTDDMAAYVRSYQRKRWGRDHLITVSMAEPEPKGLNADTAFRHPGLDFATAHLYLGASRGPSAGQEVQAGRDFAGGVRYALGQIRDNRPFMDGESGPIDRWVAEEDRDNELFYQMSWSHLATGGAGPGTRWPYRHPHLASKGMLETLRSIRTFVDAVPWARFVGAHQDLTFQGAFEGGGYVSPEAGMAWLRRVGPGKLELPAGAKQPRLFDTRGRRWLAGTDVPESVREVAVFWLR